LIVVALVSIPCSLSLATPHRSSLWTQRIGVDMGFVPTIFQTKNLVKLARHDPRIR
jgi:hypothetical protein